MPDGKANRNLTKTHTVPLHRRVGSGGCRRHRQTAMAAPLEIGSNLYQSIGVKPVVNCRGTFTIITGSQSLPEVKKAMELASHSLRPHG